MDIKYNNGTYTIKLSETETTTIATVPNIFRCKEIFMRYMSDNFDRAVDNQLGFLTEIQRLSNK